MLIVPGIVPGVLIVPGIVPGVFVNNKGAVGFAVCTVPAVVVVAVASALTVSSNHGVNVAVGCVVAIISEVAVAIRVAIAVAVGRAVCTMNDVAVAPGGGERKR